MSATTDANPVPHGALSAFAAKADDLDEIKKSVNDAASASGALWLSYLFVLLYTAVSVGGVTSADLFMENSVKPPFLSTDLPLRAFFLLAPVLFLITHVYTLMSFVILSDRAKWYHRELARQLSAAGREDPIRARQIQEDLRRQLVSNIFVQFLAGPGDLRQGAFGLVLKLIVWTTLVFAPIVLLLEVQVQFLPFHDELITWAHRVVLLLDVVAVWWLGYRILAGRFSDKQIWRRWAAGSAQLAVVFVSVLALVFSWTIANFGDENDPKDMSSSNILMAFLSEPTPSFLHEYFFNGPVDPKSRQRTSYFSSTLVLSHGDIFKMLKIEDPSKVASQRAIFSARSRDFRGAIFDLSDLSQVDFEGAKLSKASFDLATVRGASFYAANMEGAAFNDAKMEAAWFHAADLTDVNMIGVNGQAARFECARLVRTKMGDANLQATTFDGANLTNAVLKNANLRGASIGAAIVDRECEAARQKHADKEPPEPPPGPVVLQTTDFTGAGLEQAFLRNADLTKVSSMHGVRLAGADLTGATVSEEKIAEIDWPSLEPQTNGSRGDAEKLKWDGEIMARSVATDGHSASPEGAILKKLFAHAARDSADYSSKLKAGLLDLVCNDLPNSQFVAQGLVLNHRIVTAGESTPALVDAMVTDPCATALALPTNLKAELVALRRIARGEALKATPSRP